jgi:uncharacterized metal-binding protein (TIGR02443 family)
MSRESRPRFIAGAVCPACGRMDRLVMEGDGEDRRRRCVACGHSDDLRSAGSREPRTRLGGSPASDQTESVPADRVRILDPSKR